MVHSIESVVVLRELRIAAIQALVAHVPQTTGFQLVAKISMFFQYEEELLAIGRVLQFDTGVLEGGNRPLRALYHVVQSQQGSCSVLHRLHTRLMTLESRCTPLAKVSKTRKYEALQQARDTGSLTIGPARTKRLLINDAGLAVPVLPTSVRLKYGTARAQAVGLATDPALVLFKEVYHAFNVSRELSLGHVKYFQRHDFLALPDADSPEDPGREITGTTIPAGKVVLRRGCCELLSGFVLVQHGVGGQLKTAWFLVSSVYSCYTGLERYEPMQDTVVIFGRWCDEDTTRTDCYGNRKLKLAQVADQGDRVKRIYKNNATLRRVDDFYDIISGDMVVNRVPSPVLAFSAPGRVVTSAAEYSRSTRFAIKWPGFAY